MKSRIIFLLVVGVIFFAAIVFAQFSEYVPTKNNKDVYRKAPAGSVVTKFYENAAERWSETKAEIMPIKIEDNGDDVIVTLSLVSVSDELTFNQEHTPDNTLEYRWEIRIDTDDNSSTGDYSGYDVAISLTHFKPSGSLPFQGTILDGTQKNTWILSETGGQYGHEIEATLNYETKSIVMVAQKSWEELMDFDGNDRFSFNTYYRPIDGGVQDVTSANQPGSNIVFDPEGDVDYSFIDIVSGKVEIPGISDLPDLTISDVDGPYIAIQGECIRVTVVLENQGTADLTQTNSVLLKVVLSSDRNINNDDILFINELILDVSVLNAGRVNTEIIVANLPNGLLGSYYIGAIIDADFSHDEVNENNNTNYDYRQINIQPSIDIGFRPGVNGFNINNEPTKRTWDMFETLYGKEAVESDFRAKWLFDYIYEKNCANQGSCVGLASASLLAYFSEIDQSYVEPYDIDHYEALHDISTPNSRIFELPDNLPSSISYYHGICTTREFWELPKLGPLDALSQIKIHLLAGNPIVLGVISLDTNKLNGAHLMSPYKVVVNPSNPDEVWVMVYDPNYHKNYDLLPEEFLADNRKVVFNVRDNNWTFEFNHSPYVLLEGTPDNISTYFIKIAELVLFTHRCTLPDLNQIRYMRKMLVSPNFEYDDLNKNSHNLKPKNYKLSQNYPNPFNSETTIKYELPRDCHVSLKVYNTSGQEIANLIELEYRAAGFYSENWNGENIASGVYFYRLETDEYVQIKKMILIK